MKRPRSLVALLRFAALGLLVGSSLAVPARAQGGPLTIEDGPVAPPDDYTFTLRNATAAAVTLDSLAVAWGEGAFYSSLWYIGADVVFSCTLTQLEFHHNGGTCTQGVTLDPGAALTVAAGFDPCGTCVGPGSMGGGAVGATLAGTDVDTLLVYSGGVAEPDTVLLDRRGIVGTDARPEADGPSVYVAPNPAAGSASVSVRLVTAGRVRVTVVDALGREVARLHEGPAGAGVLSLRVDVGRLPAGLYGVRAETPAGATSTRLVVTR